MLVVIDVLFTRIIQWKLSKSLVTKTNQVLFFSYNYDTVIVAFV